MIRRLWIKLRAFLSVANAVVLVEEGRARVIRGTVRSRLLDELGELARAEGIETACIRASRDSTGFRLAFIGVPEALHQRFRNVWAANWK